MKRHLLSAADLTRDDALLVLDTAEELRSLADRPIKKLPTLRGRTVVNLFFEDSTRTRISFEAAAKRLSADVINFSAKGSSVSQGREPQGHRAHARGDGCRRSRHPPRFIRGSAPARHQRLGQVVCRQRRRRHPRASDAGPARRVHAAPPPRRPRRAPGDDRGRRPAQPGGTLQRAAAAAPWAPRSRWLRPRRCSLWGSTTWPVETSYDLDTALDKCDAVMMLRVQTRADEQRVLPQRPRVQPALRPRRPPVRTAARARDRDASRADEPRHGDLRERRRLDAFGHRRAGHQRRRGPDGRALPAAQWLRSRRGDAPSPAASEETVA